MLLDSSLSTTVSRVLMSIFSIVPYSVQTTLNSSISSYYTEFVDYGAYLLAAVTESNNMTVPIGAGNPNIAPSTSISSWNSEFGKYAVCNAVYSDMATSPYNYILLVESDSRNSLYLRWNDLVTAYTRFQNDTEHRATICDTLTRAESLVQSLTLHPSPYLVVGSSTVLPYDTFVTSVTDNNSSVVVANYYPFLISYPVTSHLFATNGFGTFTLPSTYWTNFTTTASHETTIFQGSSGQNSLYGTTMMTPNITRLVNCGVSALVYDYFNEPQSFNNFVNSHLNETYVKKYKNLIQSFTATNINENAQDYQRVYAGFYNFIFQNPADRLVKLLNYMGYCYMERETNSDAPFTMSDYSTGVPGAKLFTDVFSFGFDEGYICFSTSTGEDSSTTILSDFCPILRNTKFMFPNYIDDGVTEMTTEYYVAATISISNAGIEQPGGAGGYGVSATDTQYSYDY
ncbi:unnamed protein product [Ambrosiozyma monospora]|uniref:Unnamed protein product n=1 Tax=Ambrosiozyma monospora TaxID=43982 RepID=A0ACB5STG1_AMBMO|nr:unnamed protein product [Ambrosiozyma monospora]